MNAAAGKRRLKKALAWAFWAANLLVIIGFWMCGPAGQELVSGNFWLAVHALSKLLGLLAMFSALTQFILIGRLGWLEPIFGLDHLAIFHRRNGMAAISLILAHSFLITVVHFVLTNGEVLAWTLPYVWLALIAELIFITTVGMTLYIIRKRLRFETWYAVHLLNYLAIVIVPFHQLANGDDFLSNKAFTAYWLGLYAFVALNVIFWRFGMTLINYLRYDFKVEKVVSETPNATSVYIGGRNLRRLRAKGGQFVMVRFLDRRFVWQEHPFSLSMIPTDNQLRLTVRQLGDFTNKIPELKPGTPVWVSGPFGTFTNDLQTKDKALYIAGGIGITPIRAMIEARANTPTRGEAVLIYGNRTSKDTTLLVELQNLSRQTNLTIYNVLSEQPKYSGETGYVDQEKISRLVPDFLKRDVFICGPPPMMFGIIDSLKAAGLPAQQIHYERFALHKN